MLTMYRHQNKSVPWLVPIFNYTPNKYIIMTRSSYFQSHYFTLSPQLHCFDKKREEAKLTRLQRLVTTSFKLYQLYQQCIAHKEQFKHFWKVPTYQLAAALRTSFKEGGVTAPSAVQAKLKKVSRLNDGWWTQNSQKVRIGYQTIEITV